MKADYTFKAEAMTFGKIKHRYDPASSSLGVQLSFFDKRPSIADPAATSTCYRWSQMRLMTSPRTWSALGSPPTEVMPRRKPWSRGLVSISVSMSPTVA